MSVAFEYGTQALRRLPLINMGEAGRTLAWHDGRAVSVGEFLADVATRGNPPRDQPVLVGTMPRCSLEFWLSS